VFAGRPIVWTDDKPRNFILIFVPEWCERSVPEGIQLDVSALWGGSGLPREGDVLRLTEGAATSGGRTTIVELVGGQLSDPPSPVPNRYREFCIGNSHPALIVSRRAASVS
jgi:hypothetical protein